jgi:thermolysin
MKPSVQVPLLLLLVAGGAAAGRAGSIKAGTAVAAGSGSEADAWGLRIEQLAARDELRLAKTQADPDFPDRRHLRYDQWHTGARVFGQQLVRQLDAQGRTLSVFGHLLEGLALDTAPRLRPEQAAEAAESLMGRGARAGDPIELVVLPLADRVLLAYSMRVVRGGQIERYFVDAATGELAHRLDEVKTDAAVGAGTGVWNDRKKMSADRTGSTFRANDRLRPPALLTYDFQGSDATLSEFLQDGFASPSDIAADSDNSWTDGAVVDAHAYSGYTYDYYFKRHGRHGLDNNDIPLRSITHPGTLTFGLNNAAYLGSGVMVYLEGDGFFVNFAAGLDVVAHELTHGVTEFSWNGIYQRESGALNEAFSDIIGASVEFFFEPAGNARKRADYFIGEDIASEFDPARNALRSMENPGSFCHGGGLGCDPDHYRKLFAPAGPCTRDNDNCGVHINSGIANQAFYLLVEGGTNRTSGISVSGLGAANRERAEKIFYRGFTSFLTPSASFADARRATIRAAQELYGAGSVEASQTAAAWTAVGVN